MSSSNAKAYRRRKPRYFATLSPRTPHALFCKPTTKRWQPDCLARTPTIFGTSPPRSKQARPSSLPETSPTLLARIPEGLVAPQIATPDQLFAKLIADGLHNDVLATVARMSARLKNPPRSRNDILDGLATCGLKATVDALRTRLAQREPD